MITLTIILTSFILRKIARTRFKMARVETFEKIVPARTHEINTY